MQLQPPVPEHGAAPDLGPHEVSPQPAAAGHTGQALRVQVDQDVDQDVVKTRSLNKNGYHVLLHDHTFRLRGFMFFWIKSPHMKLLGLCKVRIDTFIDSCISFCWKIVQI